MITINCQKCDLGMDIKLHGHSPTPGFYQRNGSQTCLNCGMTWYAEISGIEYGEDEEVEVPF